MKRVLFVDDEDWSVKPYFDILKDHGVEVDLAENGDQALDLLKKHAYDMVVLDIMFAPGDVLGTQVEPRKAGVGLLQRLRNGEIPESRTAQDVAVLLLTAVTDHDLLDAVATETILRKPVSFDSVVDRILKALGIARKA